MKCRSTILNACSAAVFVGAHVGTVRRLAGRGEIPSFKVGRDWKFSKASLVSRAESQHLSNHSAIDCSVVVKTVCIALSDAVTRLSKLTCVDVREVVKGGES